jgi:hypothetical protein
MSTITRIAPASPTLSLDGHDCGFLLSAAGGDLVAPVLTDRAGRTGEGRKTIGSPSLEPVRLELGLSMEPPVYDWISGSWTPNAMPREVSIFLTDGQLMKKLERRFNEAIVTETTVSALDGASKLPVTLSVSFAAARATEGPVSGKVGPPSTKPRRAMACNFRLDIAGLDCTRVMSIDAFTVKRQLAGDSRDMVRDAGPVEFPDLRVTMAERGSDSWQAWFQSFVVDGTSAEGDEKQGSITLLTPDLSAEICSIELSNLGIFALRRSPMTSTADKVSTFTAELYCESMRFMPPKA